MSVTTFTTALADLVITDVVRRESVIPIDVEIADLPYQYVGQPSTDQSFKTFGRVFINPTRTSELVVLVRPVVMGTNSQNYTDVGTMSNNVTTALDAAITNASIDSYQLELGTREINGHEYHAVVATVTGRDK